MKAQAKLLHPSMFVLGTCVHVINSCLLHYQRL